MPTKRKPGRPRSPQALRRVGGRIAYRVDQTLLRAATLEAERLEMELGTLARYALARYLREHAPPSVTDGMLFCGFDGS